MLEYTNSKCQASLIYITKCHTEQDVATCLLKASETEYKPVNQTNLRAHVLIALVDTSGPPPIQADFHPTWNVSGQSDIRYMGWV